MLFTFHFHIRTRFFFTFSLSLLLFFLLPISLFARCIYLFVIYLLTILTFLNNSPLPITLVHCSCACVNIFSRIFLALLFTERNERTYKLQTNNDARYRSIRRLHVILEDKFETNFLCQPTSPQNLAAHQQDIFLWFRYFFPTGYKRRIKRIL